QRVTAPERILSQSEIVVNREIAIRRKKLWMRSKSAIHSSLRPAQSESARVSQRWRDNRVRGRMCLRQTITTSRNLMSSEAACEQAAAVAGGKTSERANFSSLIQISAISIFSVSIGSSVCLHYLVQSSASAFILIEQRQCVLVDRPIGTCAPPDW
ncbi:MAG: hypothetical protein WBL65_13535, partial [Bryobacteraceae bacterium]